MSTHKDFTLGQKVFTTEKFQRYEERVKGHWWKIWTKQSTKKPLEGIYIGWRSLSDGYVDYDSGCGNVWCPQEYKKAALIVINPRQAPILVPLETLQKMED